MYSDDEDDGMISEGGTQEPRTRRVSEGNSTNTSKSNNKQTPHLTNQIPSSSRASNNAINMASKERSKSMHSLEDKNILIDKERRSDSPSQLPISSSNSPIIVSPSIEISKRSSKPINKKVEEVQASNTLHNKSTEMHNNEDVDKIKAHSVPIVSRLLPSEQVELQKSLPIIDSNLRQGPEDDLDRMKEQADALVTKLITDEENHREKMNTMPPSCTNHPPTVSSVTGREKWFYRDPQGEVQGPFLATEMADWFKAGYFTSGLLVRRTCDERYATLGHMIKAYGRVPFTPGPLIPPMKLQEQVIPPIPSPVPAGIPSAVLPKTGIEDPLLLFQYQQMQMLQNQMLMRQMRTSAIAKLSQSQEWSTLSSVEQNQLILQSLMQDPEIPELPISTNPFVSHLPPPPTTNPVLQLFSQIQQTKAQGDSHLITNPHPSSTTHPAPPMDPVHQFIQQMGVQNLQDVLQHNIAPSASVPTPTPAPIPTPPQEDNPIKSLLRQLNVNANGHTPPTPVNTVWPQNPPQITPQFNAQNWLTQVGPIPSMPPGQLPNSVWDLHAKEMKTEQQILDEQNLSLQESRKTEDLRKQEEIQRQIEEELKRKQNEEHLRLEEARRKDEERKKKEEEKKRKEEERRKQDEEQKKKEEKKRKEEEKKREDKRKQELEIMKKKLEEEKKKKEELKKQEEKHKKDEEKRKKLEEEHKKQEEERIRKETEVQKQVEAEEQARRAEQRRREAEALRKLQERSKAPWAQAPRAPAPSAQASLAEIQRLEREKKAEEQRFQQLMQQQLAQQKTIESVQDPVSDSLKRSPFKWAEKATMSTKTPPVKSLAQIQQEEQERILKQHEKERQEKAGQKESTTLLQNAGIWGTASQSLIWNCSAASNSSQVWSTTVSNTSGFWDEPVPVKPAAPTVKQTPAPKPVNFTQQQQQQQTTKATKNKNKKEEELVKKLFEQNTAKADDFTQWCNKALSGVKVSVDIPTFVGFLRDIESAYEVKEYVRDYLGENKQSNEFAKQFLEKRSKWRSAQRPQEQTDDLCKPAPAVNPNTTEFQEVKGKSKKPKKGKMFKVDNRILGFSVTAAPDRINVGDRDYGEGV
ncbi:GRB10-interacting GYF protein 2 isoform X2 [Prorops nasuta]